MNVFMVVVGEVWLLREHGKVCLMVVRDDLQTEKWGAKLFKEFSRGRGARC